MQLKTEKYKKVQSEDFIFMLTNKQIWILCVHAKIVQSSFTLNTKLLVSLTRADAVPT